jgi:hypothetical protein
MLKKGTGCKQDVGVRIDSLKCWTYVRMPTRLDMNMTKFIRI